MYDVVVYRSNEYKTIEDALEDGAVYTIESFDHVPAGGVLSNINQGVQAADRCIGGNSGLRVMVKDLTEYLTITEFQMKVNIKYSRGW